MEMIMTAGMVTADEAYRTGLVNHVVPQVELWNSVMEWHKNHEKLSLAISKAIKSINANYKDGENGFETEIKSFGKCFGTVDFKEGTAAF
jgi:enoyl-CoA hydratase